MGDRLLDGLPALTGLGALLGLGNPLKSEAAAFRWLIAIAVAVLVIVGLVLLLR